MSTIKRRAQRRRPGRALSQCPVLLKATPGADLCGGRRLRRGNCGAQESVRVIADRLVIRKVQRLQPGGDHAPNQAGAVDMLSVPASWSRKRTAAAIRGIVIADDARAVELTTRKAYCDSPRLVATIFPLSAAASNRRAAA